MITERFNIPDTPPRVTDEVLKHLLDTGEITTEEYLEYLLDETGTYINQEDYE